MRFALLMILFPSFALAGQLHIGTKEAPPFSMKDEDGSWSGLSIILWRSIAKEMGLEYAFEERSLDGLVRGLQDGSLDCAVCALTVTDEREKAFDFTHPFHLSGLGIAVKSGEGGYLYVIKSLFAKDFLKCLIGLMIVLFLAGFLLWVFEMRHNQQFREGGAGLFDAFWWSAVTMTTVGYGDKVPQTVGGKVVAFVWMFISVVILSSFTATMASSLTMNNMNKVNGPEDLARSRVAAVRDSASEAYLSMISVRHIPYKDLKEALGDLKNGKVDAVVHDAPLLHFYANKMQKVTVLPHILVRQDYSFGLPQDSDLREKINQILLRKICSEEWRKLTLQYLGK